MRSNQAQENTGYATQPYLLRLFEAVPGLDVPAALSATRAPSADAAMTQANKFASEPGTTQRLRS